MFVLMTVLILLSCIFMTIASLVAKLYEFRDDVVRFSQQKKYDNPSYFMDINLKILLK